MKSIKSVPIALMTIMILMLDMILFLKAFSPIIHPAGMTGLASTNNIIASCINLFLLIVLITLAGYMGHKSLWIGALIFFSLPIILWIILIIFPMILPFFPLSMMLVIYEGIMFQGLSFGIPEFQAIGILFTLLMPFIVIAFYLLGKLLAKNR